MKDVLNRRTILHRSYKQLSRVNETKMNLRNNNKNGNKYDDYK